MKTAILITIIIITNLLQTSCTLTPVDMADTPQSTTPCIGDEAPCVTSNQQPKNQNDDKKQKIIWATSFLWQPAPKIEIEKWLNGKPDLKDKFILIEFWNTWCPPCRRSIAKLNHFHKKYGKDFVIIGICDQPEEEVRAMKEPVIKFYNAIDTQKRMKTTLGVFGVPHAIILEPTEHIVIWQGFPLLNDYELTDEIMDKILAASKKM